MSTIVTNGKVNSAVEVTTARFIAFLLIYLAASLISLLFVRCCLWFLLNSWHL